jgi:acyl-CoA thioesterase-1
MNFRFLLILLLLTVNSVTNAETPTPTTILVFGDSLSAAYGIPREKGWPSLLQQRLLNQNQSIRVVNASISGETTAGGISRIESALKQYQPQFVIIELGANDGLQGLSLVDMQTNLNSMITISQTYKSTVILVGMMIPPNYGMPYTQEFKESYARLAKQYKLALVPFLLEGVAGNPALNIEDGYHPNVQGQPIVFENIWKVLEPSLIKAHVYKPSTN